MSSSEQQKGMPKQDDDGDEAVENNNENDSSSNHHRHHHLYANQIAWASNDDLVELSFNAEYDAMFLTSARVLEASRFHLMEARDLPLLSEEENLPDLEPEALLDLNRNYNSNVEADDDDDDSDTSTNDDASIPGLVDDDSDDDDESVPGLIPVDRFGPFGYNHHDDLHWTSVSANPTLQMLPSARGARPRLNLETINPCPRLQPSRRRAVQPIVFDDDSDDDDEDDDDDDNDYLSVPPNGLANLADAVNHGRVDMMDHLLRAQHPFAMMGPSLLRLPPPPAPPHRPFGLVALQAVGGEESHHQTDNNNDNDDDDESVATTTEAADFTTSRAFSASMNFVDSSSSHLYPTVAGLDRFLHDDGSNNINVNISPLVVPSPFDDNGSQHCMHQQQQDCNLVSREQYRIVSPAEQIRKFCCSPFSAHFQQRSTTQQDVVLPSAHDTDATTRTIDGGQEEEEGRNYDSAI